MRRCAICDYAEGVGSDSLGIPPDSRRVLWKDTHKEYQCDDCAGQIKSTLIEQEMEDALKVLEETDGEDAFVIDEDCEVPAALSGLPF